MGQTWDYVNSWTSGNLKSGYYYATDGTGTTVEPTSNLQNYIYVDASNIVPYQSETKENVFYVQSKTRVKIYGGKSATDASADNGYQPTVNYIRAYVPAGYKITITGKAGNGGNTLNLSLNGEQFTEAGLQSNANLSATNNNQDGAYAYIYSAGVGQNKSNYAAMLTKIVLENTVAESHCFTVNAVDNEGQIIASGISSGEAKEGATYSAEGLPEVIFHDGNYYQIDSNYSNHIVSGTMGTEDVSIDIIYSKDTSIVYFAEAESLSSTGYSIGGTYSGGYIASIASGVTVPIGQFPAGNYSAVIPSKEEQKFAIMTDSAVYANKVGGLVIVKGNKTFTEPFTLSHVTSLKIAGKYESNGMWASAKFDYLLIRRTGDVETVQMDIPLGASFLTVTKNLDFSDVSNLKLYAIETSGGDTVLNRVTTIPAGTTVVAVNDGGTTAVEAYLLAALSYTIESDTTGFDLTAIDDYLNEYKMPETWTTTRQNRGLWACQTNDGGTFVSWRSRKDDVENTTFKLYRNDELVDIFSGKTNVIIPGTADTYSTDTYRLEVLNGGVADEGEGMVLGAGSVKQHQYFRIRLADEPTVSAAVGTMWNKSGVDDGYQVRYLPNDMSCYDMDGDGEEELIVKWDPTNSQDNGYSGYTANVYIDCYKPDYSSTLENGDVNAQLMWRIDLGQNIRAGAHYTQFLCYDFDGDGKGEIMMKTSLGSKDGEGKYVFQSRINEKGLDVNRDYTRSDDNGNSQKSNGHIGVGEEWVTVFDGVTGAELASVDYYPKFNVSDWDEGTASNKYNKGTRFKACVAFIDGVHPTAIFNRGYYTQSFFTAYNWNGKHLYEVWRHASTIEGEGLYGEGNHSLVVGDLDGDGKDEIGVGAAALDDDGTVLWRTGYNHGDALHLGDFDPDNEGMEIFYVNEEYNYSPYCTALLDAATGKVLHGEAHVGIDVGRGLALHISKDHNGAQLFGNNLYFTDCNDQIADWTNGSLLKDFKTTDEYGNSIGNDVLSYSNYRIYWDGDLYDEWMDSRHVDKMDEDNKFYRTFTFDTPTHPAHSINGTKENPNLQTDLFGDWREEVVFYTSEVTGTETRSYTSKTTGDGMMDWDIKQHYLVVFTTIDTTEYSIPWLRDDHVYDMSVVWQNVGYNQPPHLSFDPAKKYGTATAVGALKTDERLGIADGEWYNLSGLRVRPTQAGIYVGKNKKFLVK